MSKRRQHAPEFKAKVALKAVKGDQTVSELASRFAVQGRKIAPDRNRCGRSRTPLLRRPDIVRFRFPFEARLRRRSVLQNRNPEL